MAASLLDLYHGGADDWSNAEYITTVCNAWYIINNTFQLHWVLCFNGSCWSCKRFLMHSLVSACTEIVEFCLLSWFCRGGLNGGMLLSFLTAFYPISAGVSLLPPLWRHQGKGWTEYPSHDQSIEWFACRVALAIFFLRAYFRRSSIP